MNTKWIALTPEMLVYLTDLINDDVDALDVVLDDKTLTPTEYTESTVDYGIALDILERIQNA